MDTYLHQLQHAYGYEYEYWNLHPDPHADRFVNLHPHDDVHLFVYTKPDRDMDAVSDMDSHGDTNVYGLRNPNGLFDMDPDIEPFDYGYAYAHG